jgi:hypothetical protein
MFGFRRNADSLVGAPGSSDMGVPAAPLATMEIRRPTAVAYAVALLSALDALDHAAAKTNKSATWARSDWIAKI